MLPAPTLFVADPAMSQALVDEGFADRATVPPDLTQFATIAVLVTSTARKFEQVSVEQELKPASRFGS